MSRKTLSVITACLPTISLDFLEELNASLEPLRSAFSTEWKVCLDGPGGPEVIPGADSVVRFPRHGGTASARNAASAHSSGKYIFSLDADDRAVTEGIVRAVELMEADSELGWVAGNRRTIEGHPTIHWHGERDWAVGELSENWTSPFPFQPNTVVARADAIWGVLGWPATPVGQDLALSLALGETWRGKSIRELMTLYRVWPGQTVQNDNYVAQQALLRPQLTLSVNAMRLRYGREPVAAPAQSSQKTHHTISEEEARAR